MQPPLPRPQNKKTLSCPPKKKETIFSET